MLNNDKHGGDVNPMNHHLKIFSTECYLCFSILIICKLIVAQGCETPTGRAVRWRLLMAQSVRRLTVRPVESEQPGAKINYFQKQQCMLNQPK